MLLPLPLLLLLAAWQRSCRAALWLPAAAVHAGPALLVSASCASAAPPLLRFTHTSVPAPGRRYEKHIAEEELDKLSKQQEKAAKKAAQDEVVAAAGGGVEPAPADE